MCLAEAGCFVLVFILHISGVHGQANSICALKGSSVELPCTDIYSSSSKKLYTLHLNNSRYILKNFSGDENRTLYNMSKGGNLIINDLRESDENTYCCGSIADIPGRCWFHRTELQVADLQVKVIPTTEGQTVTLMCSTGCPLTENPATYIWYKNGEFLYQDRSPWYQHLVGSDEAVTYSCAVKGYEDIRAPEVSVDSLTSTCFNVTYARGRMCSYNQLSVDEPCSITYPREVYVQRTPPDEEYVRLTCTPSCPLTDPHAAYRWYRDEHLYKFTESQNLTVPRNVGENYLCAVRGHEDLHSAEVCSAGKICLSLKYASRRICALEGSSVNISVELTNADIPQPNLKFWYKITRRAKEISQELIEAAGRVEYRESMKNRHILRINDLKRNDSAEYTFEHRRNHRGSLVWKHSYFPGVTLVVSGLKVTMTPAASVTEAQGVTLTCSTSCPLTDNTTYTWYLNGQPLTLPGNHNKRLVLDPVGRQQAGNYSCAVNTHSDIRSPEETLTVQALGNSIVTINVVRLTIVPLIPVPLLLFYLWMRWK